MKKYFAECIGGIIAAPLVGGALAAPVWNCIAGECKCCCKKAE